MTGQEKALLEAIARIIDEAQKEIRDDTVDPKLLKDLGMSLAQFKAFIEEYSSRFGAIKQMADRTQPPDGSMIGAIVLPGEDKTQAGKGADGSVGNSTGSQKLSTDEIRKLSQARAAKVSPEYRKEVEAFFRAISESSGNEPASMPAGK